MEPYYSLVFSFGLHTVASTRLVDIVGEVPEEIGVMILRLLDPRTLLSAALVSKKWLNLCHADSTLRKRIFQQIHKERIERLKPFPFIIEREHRNRCVPFSTLNGNNRMTVSHGSNGVRPGLSRIWAPVVRHFGSPATGQPTEMAQKKKKKCSKLKSLGKTSMASIAKRMRL